MSSILRTGKTATFLNGVPENWFSCAKGLHQGDPLSPYLFIIVTDILRRLIDEACRSGVLHHSTGVTGCCPVLQYVDDTLTLVRGHLDDVAEVKGILDAFAAATGLVINFHKTTFIPMNVDPADAASMAATLGCLISSFPQPYLGLPISPTRLHVSDFVPLVSKFDKYLAGWKGRLLSSGGCLQLTNSILSSLPVYFMSSLPLHKTVIKAIDRRRRAFVWTGEEKCSGSRCLIAWDRAMLSRLEGGLGIKNLEVQNHCLLLKFVHKVFTGANMPWRDWLLRDLGADLGSWTPYGSFLGRLLNEELERYCSLTRVVVHNGRSTSFWFDDWIGSNPLATQFPAIFSHCTHPYASVAATLQPTLMLPLCPRLSQTAERELAELSSSTALVELDDSADERVFIWGTSAYSSRATYRCLTETGAEDQNSCLIWATRVPTKVKFFAWLLCSGRLSTRSNLLQKKCLPPEEAHCPRCHHATEDHHHLFYDCPTSASVWSQLRETIPDSGTPAPWDIATPTHLPGDAKNDALLTVHWHIWTAWNNKVFNDQDEDSTSIIRSAAADMEF